MLKSAIQQEFLLYLQFLFCSSYYLFIKSGKRSEENAQNFSGGDKEATTVENLGFNYSRRSAAWYYNVFILTEKYKLNLAGIYTCCDAYI
jgi:hypothetical protein